MTETTTQTTDPFAPYRPVLLVDAAQVTDTNVDAMVEALGRRGVLAEASHHPDGAVFVTTERAREVACSGDWIVIGPHGPFIRPADEFAHDYTREETRGG